MAMIRLISLFMLISLASIAQTLNPGNAPYVAGVLKPASSTSAADIIIDFETGANGDLIDKFMLTNATTKGTAIGGAFLIYSNSAVTVVGSNTMCKISTAQSVVGTRSMAQTVRRQSSYWEMTLTTAWPICSAGYFIKYGGEWTDGNATFDLYDLVELKGGSDFLDHNIEYRAQAQISNHVHTAVAPNTGEDFTPSTNTWYWVQMFWTSGQAGTGGTMKFYSYPALTLLQTSDLGQNAASVNLLHCGRVDVHGDATASFNGTIWFDYFCFSTNGATLWPP